MRLVQLLTTTLAVAAPFVAKAQATGSIRGTVRDSAGRPVAGASVMLDAPPHGITILDAALAVHVIDDSTRRRATTDDNGRFVMDAVRPGRHVVLVRRVPFAPFTSDSFDVIAGRQSLVQIGLASEWPREVVLGCRRDTSGAPADGSCYGARHIKAPCCVPNGSGVVRDEATWNALWDVYGNGKQAPHGIHWDREMLFLSSLNSTLGEHWLTVGYAWAATHEFNRALEFRDSLVIELGPDSLFVPDGVAFGVIPMPVATIMPRVDTRVVVRFVSGRPDYDRGPDRSVSWDSLARVAAERAPRALGTYVLPATADSLRPLRRPFLGPRDASAELLAAELTLAPHGRLTGRLTSRRLDSGAVAKRTTVTGFWTIVGDSVVLFDKTCKWKPNARPCDPPLVVGGLGFIAGDTVSLRRFAGFGPHVQGAGELLRFVRRQRVEPG